MPLLKLFFSPDVSEEVLVTGGADGVVHYWKDVTNFEKPFKTVSLTNSNRAQGK